MASDTSVSQRTLCQKEGHNSHLKVYKHFMGKLGASGTLISGYYAQVNKQVEGVNQEFGLSSAAPVMVAWRNSYVSSN